MSLFHYTNINAIYSILSTKKLWLTDIRFLNDTSEWHEGVHTLTDAMKSPIPPHLLNKECSREAIKLLQSGLNEMGEAELEDDPVFVFSLSRAKDLLSQWRAYGCYALEFDEDILREHNLPLKDCIYNLGDKNQLAHLSILNAIDNVSHKARNPDDNTLGLHYVEEMIKLLELAVSFKDSAFSEESEARIVLNQSTYGNEIKFRQRNHILIPYIEIDIELDCIKAIQLGPMRDQELAFTSMQSFVKNIVRNFQYESGDIEFEIKVMNSTIPYRE